MLQSTIAGPSNERLHAASRSEAWWESGAGIDVSDDPVGGLSAGYVVLGLVAPNDTNRIVAAIELGNRYRETLGHMPFAVYEDAAANEGLLLASEGGVAIGYALFGVTSQYIRLTHLCVDEAHRKRGIARALVEWISSRHADRPGVRVWCRRDYRLGPMWAKLGFERQGERPGRGRHRKVLVAWWRDHGHPRLFERPLGTAIFRASVDVNIVRDLADDTRGDHEESSALLADQFADRLEVVRTPALDIEIDQMEDPMRAACMRVANGLRSVHAARGPLIVAQAELLDAANTFDPRFANEEPLDIQYVSEAVGAGLNAFVTRDEQLTRALEATAEAHGLRILRPAEVIVGIDELVRAEAYRGVALQETDYTRKLIRSGREREMEALHNSHAGERLADFRRRIRTLTTAGLSREGLYAPDGRLVGAFAARHAPPVLEVPLLRVAESSLADTLVRQLLFVLRQEARRVGASVIRLDDPFVSRSTIAAASDDGFMPHEGGRYAYVIDVCGAAYDVGHAAVAAARAAHLPPPASIRAGLPATVAAEVERAWWPAKVVDSQMPNYLLPIRQGFSNELLGEPRTLFRRSAQLGLSREQVYYRSPAGAALKAPGRLLWYMSASSRGAVVPAGVIGSSHLDEIVEASPEELDSRFRHLGVWRLEQIAKASRNGVAQALRFANTELFPNPIPLDRLRTIVRAAPQSPVPISNEVFASLYRQGQLHD